MTHSRVVRAMTVIAALVIVAILIEAALSMRESTAMRAGESIVFSQSASQLAFEGSFERALLGGAGLLDCRNRVTGEFADEVVSPSSDEVFASDDGSLVGFVSSGSPEEAFAKIGRDLAGNGWVLIEGSQPCAGTFVKQTGRYCWALVSCHKTGDTVSTIIQVQ